MQLLLFEQPHVHIFDVGVDQSGKHECIKNLGMLHIEPREQLLQHWDVVGNTVVKD